MIGYSLVGEDGALLRLPKRCPECRTTKPEWKLFDWHGSQLDEPRKFVGWASYNCSRCRHQCVLDGEWSFGLLIPGDSKTEQPTRLEPCGPALGEIVPGRP